jgi:hypothetical protein
MDEPKPTKPYEPEWQTKQDIARRQIVEAIRMFFERRDAVATHTVISAAHQVLTDLAKGSQTPSVLRRSNNRKNINFGSNFLKHADKDPSGRINVEPLPALNAEFLMDAVGMLQNVTGDLPFPAKFYFSWFVTKHEDLFENITPEMLPRLTDMDIDDFQTIAQFLEYQRILGDDFEKAVDAAIAVRRAFDGCIGAPPETTNPPGSVGE